MRESCLNCARKHISQAEVLAIEAVFGYPEHRWLAIAHLAEAEAELQDQYLSEAYEVRAHRKAYEADPNYRVPTIELIRKLTGLDGQKEKDPKTEATVSGT